MFRSFGLHETEDLVELLELLPWFFVNCGILVVALFTEACDLAAALLIVCYC